MRHGAHGEVRGRAAGGVRDQVRGRVLVQGESFTLGPQPSARNNFPSARITHLRPVLGLQPVTSPPLRQSRELKPTLPPLLHHCQALSTAYYKCQYLNKLYPSQLKQPAALSIVHHLYLHLECCKSIVIF